MATGVLLRARPVLRERRRGWFVALEIATSAVALGLVLRGRPVGALVNAALVAAFALVWWRTGLRPRSGHRGRR